jgi:hypothetical protein
VKALRTTNETMWATINQDGKEGRENTNRHQFPLFSTKLTMRHELGEELPIDMVISLFQVLLAHNVSNFRSSRYQPTVQALIGYKN